MSTTKGANCPTWYDEIHIEKDVEDIFPIHWKGFGNLPDRTKNLIRVWVAFEGSKRYSSGVEVDHMTTDWAIDMHTISELYLEAALWMEEFLSD